MDMKAKHDMFFYVKLPFIILIIAVAVMLLCDYKFSEEKYNYVSSEGVLSSTTFMIEDEKPYAVSFENESYNVVYIPEELTAKAKELLSNQLAVEKKEYIRVTCILKETTKDTAFLPSNPTYQIIEIEATE